MILLSPLLYHSFPNRAQPELIMREQICHDKLSLQVKNHIKIHIICGCKEVKLWQQNQCETEITIQHVPTRQIMDVNEWISLTALE